MRCGNRECIDAANESKMVPTGVLRKLKLSKAKRNYSKIEQEALGMVYSVTKYSHYFLGWKFSFHVDHSAIVYLVSKASLTCKLARWT